MTFNFFFSTVFLSHTTGIQGGSGSQIGVVLDKNWYLRKYSTLSFLSTYSIRGNEMKHGPKKIQ